MPIVPSWEPRSQLSGCSTPGECKARENWTESSKGFLVFAHLVLHSIDWCRESSYIPGSSPYSRGKEKGQLWAYCSGFQRAAQGKDFVQPDSEHQAWTWLAVRCQTEGFCDTIKETILLQKDPRQRKSLQDPEEGVNFHWEITCTSPEKI